MKKLIFISFISSLFFLTAVNKVYAQQTFVCAYIGPASQPCIVDVNLSDPECSYSPGGDNQNYCAQFNGDEDACNNAAGYCQSCSSPSFCTAENTCPSNSSSSTGTCANPSEICCLQDDITPPPPETCYKCVNNFGTNQCVAVAPEEDSTCGVNWSDPVVCNQECEDADTFTSFYCDEVENQCLVAAPGEGEFEGPNAYTDCQAACIDTGGSFGDQNLFCDADGNPTNRNYNGQIYTAIGCIDVENITLTSSFLTKLGLGIGGGLSLLLMGIAGVLISTSAGDPRRLQAGQELLTAAIAGLMLVIFSAFILRVLGVEILGIPNLAATP